MNDKKIHDEKVISDMLESYHKDKKKIHIVLKRVTSKGDHEWLNGYAIRRPTEKVWVIDEDKLGEIRLHVSEILNVELYEDEDEFKTADKFGGDRE